MIEHIRRFRPFIVAVVAVALRTPPYGIVVSLVYPSVTATEFHEVLRQGATPSRRLPFEPQTPESVAEAILRAIETGEAEIVLGHAPLAT